ncbi:YetF domain-containing protein [Clostridium sardiniense]|uniref:YetF domain-containing protein n=1 Tax=Clostridium sardiniense TaxID=29369 RepID=UPI00195A4463
MVIENGIINFQNLKKIRLSVDMLEKRLRQLGIASIKDVKYATVEVSGELGYELKGKTSRLRKVIFRNLLMK